MILIYMSNPDVWQTVSELSYEELYHLCQQGQLEQPRRLVLLGQQGNNLVLYGIVQMPAPPTTERLTHMTFGSVSLGLVLAKVAIATEPQRLLEYNESTGQVIVNHKAYATLADVLTNYICSVKVVDIPQQAPISLNTAISAQYANYSRGDQGSQGYVYDSQEVCFALQKTLTGI